MCFRCMNAFAKLNLYIFPAGLYNTAVKIVTPAFYAKEQSRI